MIIGWIKKRKQKREMEEMFLRNQTYPAYDFLNTMLNDIRNGKTELSEFEETYRREGPLRASMEESIRFDGTWNIKAEIDGNAIFLLKANKLGCEIRYSYLLLGRELREVDMRSFAIVKEIQKNALRIVSNPDKYQKMYEQRRDLRILEELKEEETKNQLRNELRKGT